MSIPVAYHIYELEKFKYNYVNMLATSDAARSNHNVCIKVLEAGLSTRIIIIKSPNDRLGYLKN